MADNKGNLYLYEAIELRTEFDRHLELLKNLTAERTAKRGFFNHDDEDKDPAAEFDQNMIDDDLKKLRIKRIKFNQEIQKTNFNAGYVERLKIQMKLITCCPERNIKNRQETKA